MMVKRDSSLLTEEIKRMTDATSKNIHKIEQKPADDLKPNTKHEPVATRSVPDLGRSVFSNQVSDAKADLKMGNTIDVRL